MREAPRGNFIAINTHIKKKGRHQINNLTLQLKEIKKEQTKPKARRKEIKIRVNINEIDTKKTIEIINKAKSWGFLKVNTIDTLSKTD